MDNEILEDDFSEVRFDDALKSVDSFLANVEKIAHKQELLYKIDLNQAQDLAITLSHTRLPKNYVSYKDLLREKLSEKFTLETNDLILFLEDGIYIKFFKQIENKSAQERRACGLNPEELQAYKEEFFPNDSFSNIVFELLPYIVEDVLTFKKLDPPGFKKTFVHVLVNMVEIIVINEVQTDDLLFIRGMSFYLLRTVFDEVMLYIADDILYNFANNDKKATEFLSLFSVHEIIDNKGVRHKPNPILDDNNHAWNMTTIRSTMLQHKKAKQAVYEKKENLVNVKKKFDAYKMEQINLSAKIQLLENEAKELQNSLDNLHVTIEKIQQSTSEKVKFKDNGVEKVFDRKPLLQKILRKEDEFFHQKHTLQKDIEALQNSIENKQKDIDIWERKYKEGKELLASIEKTGHPTDKIYENIRKALAKTLAKR